MGWPHAGQDLHCRVHCWNLAESTVRLGPRLGWSAVHCSPLTQEIRWISWNSGLKANRWRCGSLCPYVFTVCGTAVAIEVYILSSTYVLLFSWTGVYLPALPVGGASPGSSSPRVVVDGDWPIVPGRHGGPRHTAANAIHVWQTFLQVQVTHKRTFHQFLFTTSLP